MAHNATYLYLSLSLSLLQVDNHFSLVIFPGDY